MTKVKNRKYKNNFASEASFLENGLTTGVLDYRVLWKRIIGFSIFKIHIVVDITNVIFTFDIY